ncbi:protocadherin Fat 4-like [Saccostrea cucullata]|uniref:protocadherin Fat 4-like n=1 Tax=Saccostrea cuccullata TaxID=36930 RepID=UPI002ED00B74
MLLNQSVRGAPVVLEEARVCHGPCCQQDCEITEWKSWSYCSTTCGKGIRTREREVVVPSSCNGTECPPKTELFESEECEISNTIDCQLSDWTQWSACSENCGSGMAIRSRRLLTPAYCGGSLCHNETLMESIECESYTASTDCVMTEWGEWTECERNCNGGKQTRSREILLAQQCKGAACPHKEDVRTHCHSICDHPEMCNQGVCGCREGYRMSDNGYTCLPVKCAFPSIKYCPPSRTEFFSCRHPSSILCKGYDYLDTCTVSCITDWFLKGPTNTITCLANGTWSYPQLFCAPPNNPPYSMKVDNTNIKENREDVCVYLSTVDDSYDAQTYSILADPKNIFQVSGSKLCLKRKADYEEKPTKWNVTVRCTDMEGAYVDNTFQFQILNENDPPKSARLSPNTIPENSMAGTHVGCFSAQDDDPGQNVSLLLVDSEHGMFTSYFNGSQLCLKVLKQSDHMCLSEGGKYCVLNREEQRVHSVTVMVQDDYSPPGISYFNLPVTLKDVSDKPESVTLDPSVIPEEVKPGDPLTALRTIDEDEHQLYLYELMEDDTGLFSIVNGSLVSSVKFNFEKSDSKEFHIKVRSSDNGSPSYSVISNLTFTIGDVNEPPHDLHLTSFNAPIQFPEDKPKLKENLKASYVGTIVVKDQDKEDNLEMKLLDDLGGRLAIMNADCSQEMNTYCLGTLVAFGSFDHEEEGEVNISVSVTDSQGLEMTAEWTMEILDVNDAPTEILINGEMVSGVSVTENSNGAIIADLTAADQDKNDTHSFLLLDSADRRFTLKGTQLLTSDSANLDFESTDSYVIRIVVKDDGKPTLSFEKSVSIMVKDENEAPRNIILSANKVPERSEPGLVIGTLRSEDPDNSRREVQTFVYSLENDAKGQVEVKGHQLLVKRSTHLCGDQPCEFDFEKESSIDIKVKVTDSGSPPLTFVKTITLEVTDENDPPQDVRLAGNSIAEGNPPGTVIGRIVAVDQDIGQTLIFTLLNYTDVFVLRDDNSLAVILSLDYEQQAVYALSVRCRDDGEESKTVDSVVTINVLDVNEPPSFSGVVDITVEENRETGEVIGTVTATDPDLEEQLVFTLTRGYNNFVTANTTCFTEPEQGTRCISSVSLKHRLDFEMMPVFSLTLSVQDNAGLTDSSNFRVNVQDINEPPTRIFLNGKSLTSLSVNEMTQNETIAELSALDPDQHQFHKFSLESGEKENFEIIENKLRVRTSAVLDFEAQEEHHLIINIMDNGLPPLSLQAKVTVHIENLNEAPQALVLDNNRVPENAPEGEVIGQLLTTDPDNRRAQTQTFTYIMLSNQDSRFKIVGNQLQIGKANSECGRTGGNSCGVNFEDSDVYNVTVMVTDNGLPPQSKAFSVTVYVTDVNDRPTNLTLSGHKVQSLAPKDTVIGQLLVMDEDVDQSLVFSLVSGGEALFLVSSEGQVTKATDQPLKSGQIYNISVQAVDDGQPQLKVTSSFQIAVLGVNTPVSVNFTTEGGVKSFPVNHPVVMENSPAGTVIGSLEGVTNGVDETLTFSLEVKDKENPFSMGDVSCNTKTDLTTCTVSVKVKGVLDFEEQSFLSVVVTIENREGGKLIEMFKITIENENEAPWDVRASSPGLVIPENTQGLVAIFQVTDPDVDDTHTFTLLDGEQFTITPQGHLSTNIGKLIDFEESPHVNITVEVIDSGGLTLRRNFTIHVENINEKPTQISLSNNKVKEMSDPGTIIGHLVTRDPDFSQIHTYRLLDDAGGRILIQGNTVQVAAKGDKCEEMGGSSCLLDFESKRSFSVLVSSQDSGFPPLNLNASLTIHVTDVNDPPHDLVLSLGNLPEDTLVGEVVGTLEVSNAELEQTVSFSTEEEAGVFVVEGNLLVLKKLLDYETKPVYNLTITATDNGLPPAKNSQTYQINVVDVNEAPFGLQVTSSSGNTRFPENKPVIAENSGTHVLIGQVMVQDYDNMDVITMGTTSVQVGLFNQQCLPLAKMVHCTSDLRTLVSLDYEMTPHLTFELTAVDREGLTIKQEFNLTVLDTNDPPSDINAEEVTYSVDEGSHHVRITSLTARDPDTGQNHTFTIISESQFFHIINRELWVSNIADLDYESKSEHDLVIRAIDSGSPPMYIEKTFTIKVNNVNEAPRNIRMTTNEIPENSPHGTVVGEIMAEDPDNIHKQIQVLQFTLTDSAAGMFALNGTQIVLISGDLDYEEVRQYSVGVMVTDNGEPSLSARADIVIHVTDANDSPTNLKLTAMRVDENCEIGIVVGSLSAVDVDQGQSLTYSLSDTGNLVVEGDKVKVTGSIDFEQMPFIMFKATATDDGHPTREVSRSFSVAVKDMNDEPTSLRLIPSSVVQDFMIPESMSIGSRVGTVEGVDPDRVDKIAFDLVDSNLGVFKLGSTVKCGPTNIQYQDAKSSVGTKCSVEVQLSKDLNFETKSTAKTLKIQAKDKNNSSITKDWTFSVKDTNDAPTDINIDGSQTMIPENEPSFIIGAVQTADEDVGDTFTYQVISHWELFRIRGDKLEVRRSLDFEEKSTYNVTIKSTDSGGLSFSKSFGFSVLDVNEKPSNISLNPKEVSNSAGVGEVVGFVTVVDPDNVDPDSPTQNHTCTVGGEGLGVLTMDPGSNVLKVESSVPLDRTEIMIIITCRDNGTPPLEYSQNISLVIKESVKIPKEVKLTNMRVVPENTESFEVGEFQVFNMLTNKPVENEMYLYFLIDVDAPFRIEGNLLKTKRAFDFETQQFIKVEINAMAFGSNLKAEYKIEIGDVNEAPMGIGIYGGGLLNENSDEGTVIGDLNTRDHERNQIYTYTIKSIYPGLTDTEDASQFADLFKLQNRTLTVGKPTEILNFEKYPVFSVQVTTTDSGSPPLSYTGIIRIVLQDVNDQPKDITLSNNQVKENSVPEAEIGMLTVIDEDKKDLHTCAVVSSEVPVKMKNSLSLVVGNGPLDYESKKIFPVEIECWDYGHGGPELRVSKTFVINVTDVNEPPFDISLSSNSIKENTPVGQVVGELSAKDVDSTKIIFHLEDNPFVQLDGINTVVTKTEMDFEQMSEFEFTVKAVDSEEAYNSTNIIIKILDVNEAPSDILLSTLRVKENLDAGVEIAVLTTSDPDNNQVYVYSITVTDYFKVVGDKLYTGAKHLDYEEDSSVELVMNSTDSGVPVLTIQRAFIIEVENVNEPLIDIILEAISPVPEDLPLGSVLSKVRVNDPDEDLSHVCQVLSSSTPFSVVTTDNNVMELTLTGMLDYETKSMYQLSIKCSDGEFYMVKDITIEVKDVNERPLGISLSGSHTVLANGTAGYIIGEISVSDPESDQTHTITVKGPNSDFMKVESKKLLLTGPIPMEILKKVPPIIKITLVATDNGQPALFVNHSFSLPITNVQIFAAELPLVSLDNQEVWEDAEIGYVIGRLFSINQTVHEDIIFKLIHNPEGLFAIKDNMYLILAKNPREVEGTSVRISVQVKNTETFEMETQNITIFIKRVDKCDVNGRKCDDNARCVKSENSTLHICSCEAGFTGDGYLCENIDYCNKSSAACFNNGTCVNKVDKHACLCDEGFVGIHCETPIESEDLCSVMPCQNGGVCTVMEGKGVICSCVPGWQGELCERSEDDCVDAVCLGNGTCVDRYRGYTCVCAEGRTGVFCQYQPSLCQDQQACGRNDVCIPLGDSKKVICANESCVVDITMATETGMDMAELEARFTEAVLQLMKQTGSLRSGNRRKRQTSSDPYIYIISITPTQGGQTWDVKFVLFEGDGDVNTREVVYEVLNQACSSNGKLTNEFIVLVCPSALLHHQLEENGGSFMLIPIIAGIVGFLAVFVFLCVCVWRKRRRKKSEENKLGLGTDKDSYTESRRSSGYSSISKKSSAGLKEDKRSIL